MHGMTGTVEHGGTTFSWWAGSSDRESEWVVHCRQELYGVSRYLQGTPSETEAQKVAEALAPLVQSLAVDVYTT
jgi:hypothetical protein